LTGAAGQINGTTREGHNVNRVGVEKASTRSVPPDRSTAQPILSRLRSCRTDTTARIRTATNPIAAPQGDTYI
jgi:hypothetical protein